MSSAELVRATLNRAPVGVLGTMTARDSKIRVGWLSCGNAAYTVAQWLTVAVLARWADVATLGAYALGNALAVPVLTLTGLQLRTLLSVDPLERFSVRDYVLLRFLGVAVGVPVLAALVFAKGLELAPLLIVLIVVVLRGLEALIDIVHAIFQRFEQPHLIGKALVLRSTASIAVLWIAIVWTRKPLLAFAASLFASLTCFIAYDLRRVRAASPVRPTPSRNVSSHRLFGLAVTALPMGLALFLTVLNTSLPKVLIEQVRGLEALGIFAAVSYLAYPGGILMTSITQASSARLAEHFRNRRRDGFNAIARRMVRMAGLLGVGGIVVSVGLGGELLAVAYGPTFASYRDLLVVFAVASGVGFIGAALGMCVTATGCYWPQTVIHSTIALVTFGACLLGIPRYGLMGAAGSVLLANVVGVTAYGVLLARRLGVAREVESCAAA